MLWLSSKQRNYNFVRDQGEAVKGISFVYAIGSNYQISKALEADVKTRSMTSLCVILPRFLFNIKVSKYPNIWSTSQIKVINIASSRANHSSQKPWFGCTLVRTTLM